MAYLPIHAMALWWILWLITALSEFNIFAAPTWIVTAQFAAFVLTFLIGHIIVRSVILRDPEKNSVNTPYKIQAKARNSFNLSTSLYISSWICLFILILSLYLSGALTEDFFEYFFKLRREEDTGESLTGFRLLDVTTKVIVWPISYTLTIVVLSLRIGSHRRVLAISIINILLFSYLWQINYPIIYLFWFFVFFFLVGKARALPTDSKTLIFIGSLIVLLVAVAAYRFGGDILGGIQRYVFGYHTAGFSFYDYHFRDPTSLLHDHSFGRSSLGFLEQVVEIVSRRIDLGFVAASSENSTFNNESVDIGAQQIILGNAFGTFLYGFYRDFHFVGIAGGGLLYGGLATFLLAKGHGSWACSAAFYVLATSWMVGMMVNPVEQAHFWFSLLFIATLALINRGIKP